MATEKSHTTLGQKLFDQAIARLNVANAIAVTAIQSLLLLNGGAIVAILGFLSQGKDTPVVKHLYIPTLVVGMVFFALGCAFTLAAAMMGYWSQSTFATNETAHAWRVLEYDNTNIPDEDGAEINLGNQMLSFAFVVAVLGLAAFIGGCGIAAWAFISANA